MLRMDQHRNSLKHKTNRDSSVGKQSQVLIFENTFESAKSLSNLPSKLKQNIVNRDASQQLSVKGETAPISVKFDFLSSNFQL